MTNVVLNGNAYSDDGTSSRDMQGGGHRQWLLPMLGDATVAVNAPVQGVLDAAAAADGSAIAAASSASASATSATNALNSYNAANAIGSGWTAVTVAEADGARTVLRVTDWTGGKGTKPGTGYVGPSGLVDTAAAATNVRGAVAYTDLTDRPTLGTAAALDVPVAAAAATSAQVVRGDDPRLAAAATWGTQLYTTSQNIAKSTFGTAKYVFVELWAGGGSGSAGQVSTGGEGGEYISALMRIADLANPVPLVIGAGGTSSSSTVNATSGKNGGNSVFGGVLTAIGGLGGTATGNGPAKSWMSAKNGGDGGGETAASRPPTGLRTTAGPGGSSVMGGGGGGGGSTGYLAGGVSQFGGMGGDGSKTDNAPATAASGSIPSGGGGGASISPNAGANLATSGAGARGQCRLTWW